MNGWTDIRCKKQIGKAGREDETDLRQRDKEVSEGIGGEEGIEMKGGGHYRGGEAERGAMELRALPGDLSLSVLGAVCMGGSGGRRGMKQKHNERDQ